MEVLYFLKIMRSDRPKLIQKKPTQGFCGKQMKLLMKTNQKYLIMCDISYLFFNLCQAEGLQLQPIVTFSF